MKISREALFGLLMMSIGAVKTWLHISTLSTLDIPTCNGQILQIPLSDSAPLNPIHCWGCYLVAAGAAFIGYWVYRLARERRSVASWAD